MKKSWVTLAAAVIAALAVSLVMHVALKSRAGSQRLGSFIPSVEHPASVTVDTSVLTPDGGTQYPSGTVVYVYGARALPASNAMALPGNNATGMSANAIGVFEGTSGQIQTSGEVLDAQFTAQGGKPVVGQYAWVANKADDNGTGDGKFTATKPSAAIQTQGYTGTDRFNYPRTIVKAFLVTDASGYAPSCDGGTCSCAAPATCTAKGILVKPEMEKTASVTSMPPSGTRWSKTGYSGFTGTDYFSAAYNATGADLRDGDVFVITWQHPYVTASYSMLSNKDSSNNGWELYVLHSAGHDYGGIRLWHAGADAGNNFPIAPGVNRMVVRNWHGQTCVVVANAGNPLPFTSTNGSFPTCWPNTAWSPASNNAANGALKLGTGSDGSTPGTIFNIAHLRTTLADDAGAPISDADMNRWARLVVPTTLSDVSRIDLPEEITTHTALLWAQNDWGNLPQPITQLGPGSPVFSWTTNGSPKAVAKIERLWTGEDLAALWRGTGRADLDSWNVPRASPFAEITYTSQGQDAGAGFSGETEIGVLYYSESLDNSDQVQPGLVLADAGFLNYTNKIWQGSFQGSGSVQTAGAPVDPKRIKIAWITTDPISMAADSPTGPKAITILNGGPTEAFYSPGFMAHYGGFVVGIITQDAQVFTSTATVPKAMVVVGDNTLLGDNCNGSSTPVQWNCAPINMMRQTFPTSGGPGVVHAFVRTGEQTLLAAGSSGIASSPGLLVNGSTKPAAHMILDECTHEGATNCTVLITLDGFWEYSNQDASQRPAAFGVAAGALVDNVHSLCGLANITCNIYWAYNQRSACSAHANTLGDTYANYQSQISGLTSGRAWMHGFDSSTPNSVTFTNSGTCISGNGNQWMNFAGATNWNLNLKTGVAW